MIETTDPRDIFDAALIPGMRDRLAESYARFRNVEATAVRELAPRSEGGLKSYRLRNCPNCSTAASADAILSAHGIDLVTCPGCTLTFSRQVMDETEDAERYQSSPLDEEAMNLRNSGPYLELETERARYYLARLAEHAPRPGRLLEIGCGTGTLLLAAEAAGWSTLGLEPGQAAASVASHRGCSVVKGYFPDDLPDSGTKFDVLAMLDVLEHFGDPVAFLRNVKQHLQPDGRLFIQVPNWDSLLVQLEGARSSVVCPGHWSYFTPESLVDTLARAAFRPLFVETVVSERDRIAAYSVHERRSVLARLRPPLHPEWQDGDALPSAANIHALRIGYKLIALFESLH